MSNPNANYCGVSAVGPNEVPYQLFFRRNILRISDCSSLKANNFIKSPLPVYKMVMSQDSIIASGNLFHPIVKYKALVTPRKGVSAKESLETKFCSRSLDYQLEECHVQEMLVTSSELSVLAKFGDAQFDR